MALKIQRSIMRVAERVLGLTGMPLPSEILDKVQLSLESRAIRDWEFFDEGITLWQKEVFSPAVAAELSYIRLSPRAIAAKKSDLVVLTAVTLLSSATVIVRVNSSGIPDATIQAVPRDSRVSSFSVIPGVDLETGAEAAASGTIVGFVPTLIRTPMSYVLQVSTALTVPSFPNLTFWHQTVNATLEGYLEGLYIPATR